LIGNISNLQLRVLRRYFNEKEYQGSKDRWDPKRFYKIWQRSIVSWHPNGDSEVKKQRKDLLVVLKELSESTQSESVFDSVTLALLKIHPRQTIPPFEDQNNRRPPEPNTLVLSYSRVLASQWGRYLEYWCEKLERANPSWTLGLPKSIQIPSLANNQKDAPQAMNQQIKALFLQRILDRSRAHDPYHLRYLSGLQSRNEDVTSSQGFQNLKTSFIGNKEATLSFIDFAKTYYEQDRLIRDGGFQEGLLFERVSGHLKMKKNSEPELLTARLGSTVRLGSSQIWQIRHAFDSKIEGLTTVKTVARILSDVESEYGARAIDELTSILKIEDEKLQRQEFTLWTTAIPKITIKKSLKDKEDKIRRSIKIFQNALHSNGIEFDPRYLDSEFDLIHLYNLLFTDRTGFCKELSWVQAENHWRNKKIQDQAGNLHAHCKKLQEDTAKPIDGVIQRLFSIQTRLIAKAIWKAIGKDWSGHIDFVIEENAFQSRRELLEVKIKDGINVKVRKEKNDKLELTEQGRTDEKFARIDRFSFGLCPYSGISLSSHQREYDHIVPRSWSMKKYGTIFNSEMNLISVSGKANQKKGNSLYRLIDLSEKYLKKAFNGRDLKQVESYLISNWKLIHKKLESVQFRHLAEEEQKIAKHVLFLPESSEEWKQAVHYLNRSSQQKVNGTQKYFIKSLMKELRYLESQENSTKARISGFKSALIRSEVVSLERKRLANQNPILEKKKDTGQSAYSHVVDATIALQIFLSQQNGEVLEFSEIAPQSVRIHRPESRSPYKAGYFSKDTWNRVSWFKETFYRMNSIPIWITRKGTLGIGFKPNRLAMIKEEVKSEFWDTVSPYLKDFGRLDLNKGLNVLIQQSKNQDAYFLIDVKKYSELLRKFQNDPKSLGTVERIISDLVYYTNRCELFDNLGKPKAHLEKGLVEYAKLNIKIEKEWKTYLDGGNIEFELPDYDRLKRLQEQYERIKSRCHDKIEIKNRTIQEGKKIFGWSEKGSNFRGRHHTSFSVPLISKKSGVLAAIRRQSIMGSEVIQIQTLMAEVLPVDSSGRECLVGPLKASQRVTLLKNSVQGNGEPLKDPWAKVSQTKKHAEVLGHDEKIQASRHPRRLRLDSKLALKILKKKIWEEIGPEEGDFESELLTQISKKPRKDGKLKLLFLSNETIEIYFGT